MKINSNYVNNVQKVNFTATPEVKEGKAEMPIADSEVLELSTKKDKNSSLSKEQENKLTHDAKVTASGWTIFGSFISTLYFVLRSDKTIAEKYNLDENMNKDSIKKIRKEQTIASLPGIIPGLSLATSTVPWIYFKYIEDPQDQKI